MNHSGPMHDVPALVRHRPIHTGASSLRRALVGLLVLYAAFLVTVAVAREHAAAELASVAAERQVEQYRAMVSGARTVTPTELSQLAFAWRHASPPPTGLSDLERGTVDRARRRAGQALIDRAQRMLANGAEYLDPAEKGALSRDADSIAQVLTPPRDSGR